MNIHTTLIAAQSLAAARRRAVTFDDGRPMRSAPAGPLPLALVAPLRALAFEQQQAARRVAGLPPRPVAPPFVLPDSAPAPVALQRVVSIEVELRGLPLGEESLN